MFKTQFSYVQTIRRRDQLFAHVFSPRIGTRIDGHVLNELTNAALNYLPQRVTKNSVYESLRVFVGTQLNQKTAAETAWRLAGNTSRLIEGVPVLPWTQQFADESVPVRVERVTPATRRDKQGFYFLLRCLGGSPCPIEFSQFVSRVSCKVLARTVGFSGKAWGRHPYAGMAQHFVGLLFFANVAAERSRETPYFHKVSIASSMLKHNKQLLDVRCRVKPCPLGYRHKCFECHIGQADCIFATHRQTYDLRFCSNCQKDAFFDSKSPAMICLRCQRACASS